MKKRFTLFLLAYYAFGSLILPKGDFAVLLELPKMYQHCKKTEHQDVNFFDFMTDHLLNLDGLLDDHDGNDDQKAHQPFSFNHAPSILFCFWVVPLPLIPMKAQKRVKIPFQKDTLTAYNLLLPPSEYSNRIFKPPILA